MDFVLEDDDEIAEAKKQINKKDQIVRIPIQLPLLILFFRKDQVLKIEGLPLDAKYAGWSFDPERQDLIYLFIESKEFEEINYGDVVPLWEGNIMVTKQNFDMQKLTKEILDEDK